jgi:hypothetical protein
MRAVPGRPLKAAPLLLVSMLAGCDSSDAPVALQANALQSTRLSAAERQGYSAECRKTWKYAPKHGNMPPAGDAKFERDLGRVCDCFVERLEDRTNRLQFLIAMQVIRSLSSPYGGPPNFKGLAAGASKIGVSDARFQELATEARKTGGATILHCAEQVAASR